MYYDSCIKYLMVWSAGICSPVILSFLLTIYPPGIVIFDVPELQRLRQLWYHDIMVIIDFGLVKILWLSNKWISSNVYKYRVLWYHDMMVIIDFGLVKIMWLLITELVPMFVTYAGKRYFMLSIILRLHSSSSNFLSFFKGKDYSGAKFFYTEPISLNKAHSTKWKAFDNRTLHLYNHSLF